MPVYRGVYVSPEKDILEWARREKDAGRIADVKIGGSSLAEDFGEYDPYGARADYFDEAEAEVSLVNGERQIMLNFSVIYGYDQTQAWLYGGE